MIKKITLLLLIGIFLISASSAATVDDLKIPSEFQDLGNGVYVTYDSNMNADEILSVVKFTKYDWEDYSTNDTENKYEVVGSNNTYNYTDNLINEVGSFELVDLDGQKYIIDFSKSNNVENLNETYSNLMEFNKLNNITPIEK